MAKVQALVVDDDDRLRETLVAVLESAGYVAASAASGAEALDRLPELRPDIILLDMLMPGIDGFEFLARLRADPTWSQVAILIASALGSTLVRAIDKQAAETLRIVGVLPKPVDIDVLLDHVRQAIGPGTATDTVAGDAPVT